MPKKVLVLILMFAAACMQRPGTRVSESPSPTVDTAPPSPASTLSPAATPSCTPGASTRASTEGPFFKSGSPEKASLVEPGLEGEKIVLTGFVLTSNCQPVSRAKVDVWHADSDGDYDNQGYRLRGHVFTDGSGTYRMETIVPAIYSGRTRHIHVKVQPPGGQVLTTQLYFPDEAANEDDSIYRADLVMQVQQGADGKIGRFDFVV